MKYVKVYLTAITLLAFVLGSCVTSHAQTQPPEVQRHIDQMRVTTLRERGIAEADGRIGYFSMLLAVLEKTEHVPASQKAQLIPQLKIYISDLESVRNKLEKDSQVSEVVRERQTIAGTISAYRFLMAKVRMLYFADRAIDLAAEMRPRLGNQTVLSRIDDIERRSNDIMSKLSDLNVQGYPGNVTELQRARQTIGLILDDIKYVRQYVR